MVAELVARRRAHRLLLRRALGDAPGRHARARDNGGRGRVPSLVAGWEEARLHVGRAQRAWHRSQLRRLRREPGWVGAAPVDPLAGRGRLPGLVAGWKANHLLLDPRRTGAVAIPPLCDERRRLAQAPARARHARRLSGLVAGRPRDPLHRRPREQSGKSAVGHPPRRHRPAPAPAKGLARRLVGEATAARASGGRGSGRGRSPRSRTGRARGCSAPGGRRSGAGRRSGRRGGCSPGS